VSGGDLPTSMNETRMKFVVQFKSDVLFDANTGCRFVRSSKPRTSAGDFQNPTERKKTTSITDH